MLLCFRTKSEPHEEDYDDFQPEISPWENGLKLMPCEWRHHLHVRLPSRGFDRWRGNATAVPDQLHQWAIVSPTVQEMSSMSRLSRSAGAVKGRSSWNPVQRWMVDSACGNDLIDKHSAKSLPKIPSPCPMVFHTANGSVSARTECPIYVKGIGRSISPYVLESTPDVLSLGRRCVDEGFTFHWEGFSTCLLYTSPSPRDRTRSRMPSSA